MSVIVLSIRVIGTCGWGGAQIIKPSLTGFLGVSQLAANGASLTSLSCAATVSASKFFFSDNVDMMTAAVIAVPSVFGARIGVKLAQKMSSELLAFIFNGMSVILIPTHFFVQQYRENNPVKLNTEKSLTNNFGTDKINLLKHSCFGITSGILSALMGVGGAPLTMSYLTLATDLPHHLVQGTMLVAVLPAVLTSAFSLAAGGHTPLLLAAAVCFGSITGSAVGANVALMLNESQLRQVYMASLLILGGRSVVAAGGNIRRLSQTYFAKK